MNAATDNATYHVDAEHGGLRLVVVVFFLLTTLVSFFVLSFVLANFESINLVAVFGALALAAVLSLALERNLKRRWPSGRTLLVDGDGVRLVKAGQPQVNIAAAEPAILALWTFSPRRHPRVQRGWHVVACALEQDDRVLAVYTLLSPKDFENLPDAASFTPLISSKQTADGPGALKAAGQQRRLQRLEQVRWNEGAEMTPADFTQFVEQVRGRFAHT